ncbi:MAG: hypothetical protein M3305_15545, partial [Actinomycetota bacterium]|nr:hypothetical protein [Actinomycetota bacterium]
AKDGVNREDSVASGEESKGQRHTARTTEHSSPPDQTTEPADRLVPSQDHPAPAEATPESESQGETEELTMELLAAYQGTLDMADDLPAIVWVRRGGKGIGHSLKVPYMRWFLRYYLIYHMQKSLSTLNRRLYAIAALANDPDLNKANREKVDLYLKSLPALPYRTLIFGVLLAALLVALPLAGFGNVLDVLPLVGSMLRFDIYYVTRSLQGEELDNAVRGAFVLVLALCVVTSLLTSPFELKRMLFNLHPATKGRITSTAAREHAYRVEGLYVLEEQVFREVGLRRPKEGRWDLLFRAFVLVLMLLLSLCLGAFALIVGMSWDIRLKYTTDAPANVNFHLPEVHWIFYALPAIIFFIAFVVGFKRLVIAVRRRRQRPTND